MRIQTCDGGEELIEGVQVEFVGEDLGDDWDLLAHACRCARRLHTLEKILLRQNIATLHNLLE